MNPIIVLGILIVIAAIIIVVGLWFTSNSNTPHISTSAYSTTVKNYSNTVNSYLLTKQEIRNIFGVDGNYTEVTIPSNGTTNETSGLLILPANSINTEYYVAFRQNTTGPTNITFDEIIAESYLVNKKFNQYYNNSYLNYSQNKSFEFSTIGNIKYIATNYRQFTTAIAQTGNFLIVIQCRNGTLPEILSLFPKIVVNGTIITTSSIPTTTILYSPSIDSIQKSIIYKNYGLGLFEGPYEYKVVGTANYTYAYSSYLGKTLIINGTLEQEQPIPDQYVEVYNDCVGSYQCMTPISLNYTVVDAQGYKLYLHLTNFYGFQWTLGQNYSFRGKLNSTLVNASNIQPIDYLNVINATRTS